jgi:hypothetical protein
VYNLYRYDNEGKTNEGYRVWQDTVVVIHGWNPDGKSLDDDKQINDLAKASASLSQSPQVLVLDWNK